jgi:6-phosphogluconolactonase
MSALSPLPAIGLLCALAACGGSSTATYTVGVNVSGLRSNGSLTLANNGSDSLTVAANGTVTFAKQIPSGGQYAVTVASQPAGETCKVSNGSGSITTPDVTVLVNCTANSYSIGGSVTGLAGSGLVLGSGTDRVSVSANGGFTFVTPLASGSAFDISIITQPANPTQTCRLINGNGTVQAGNVIDVGVACANTARFAYFVSEDSLFAGSVWAFAIDPISGALLPVAGSPFAAGDGTNSLTVDPRGAFLHAANGGAGASQFSISAYAIDRNSGALSPLAGSPFPAPASATSITLSPNGKFAYVAKEFDDAIIPYSVDAATAALSPLIPVTTGDGPYVPGSDMIRDVAVEPSGTFLYSIGHNINRILGRKIDPTTGLLNSIPGSPFPTTFATTGLAFDASGAHLYLVDFETSTGDIALLTRDGSTGALKTESHFKLPGAIPPKWVAIHPRGRFAYVGDYHARGYVFAIDPTTGTISAMNTTPLAASADILAIEPGGKFAYSVERGNTIAAYEIDPQTGALTASAQPPFILPPPANESLATIAFAP